MVVFEWFERFSQILAPDDKYDAEAAGKYSISLWHILAPDPNFGPPDKNDAIDVSDFQSKVLSVEKKIHSPQPAGLATRFPDHKIDGFTPCTSCMKSLCPTCIQKISDTPFQEQRNNVPFSSFSSPFVTRKKTGAESSLRTPRGPDISLDRAVSDRVLSAAKKHAETMISPPGSLKTHGKIFRLCTSATVLKDSLQKGLRKDMKENSSLLTSRSHGMGVTCPDGYTLFMAAAYANNLKALEIIWDVVLNDTGENSISAGDLLSERSIQGKSALHIAAERGHIEALEFIHNKHNEIFGSDAEVPNDLLGHTPLGVALLSPDIKARRNHPALLGMLYRASDKSVMGSPLPVKQRVVQPTLEDESKLIGLNIVAGMSEMPGKRIYMEDSMVCHSSDISVLLAICDGHGDQGIVSEFVAKGLVSAMNDRITAMYNTAKLSDFNWHDTCTELCLEIDSSLRGRNLQGGSTAVLAAITKECIVVVNIGDSRCILVQFKSVSKEQKAASADSWHDFYSVSALSIDHKPSLPPEKERIENSGLMVLEETMIDSNGHELVFHKINLSDGNRLSCSRSFGDFEYKANSNLSVEAQAVVALPDVFVHERSSQDAFIIIACDGIWDVMSNEDVAMFVTSRFDHHSGMIETDASILPTIGDELLIECLNRGAVDNLSVAVAALSNVALKTNGVDVAKTLHFQSDPV